MTATSTSYDSILDLCRDQHRRIVLATLAGEQRSLTVNDLTKTVLKHNHHVPITEASAEVMAEIRRSLYHVHLPKLSAEGLVDHDSEREVVELTEEFEQVQPTLSTIIDADPALETPMKL